MESFTLLALENVASAFSESVGAASVGSLQLYQPKERCVSDPCTAAVPAVAAAGAAQSSLKSKEHSQVCCSLFFLFLNGPALC